MYPDTLPFQQVSGWLKTSQAAEIPSWQIKFTQGDKIPLVHMTFKKSPLKPIFSDSVFPNKLLLTFSFKYL